MDLETALIAHAQFAETKELLIADLQDQISHVTRTVRDVRATKRAAEIEIRKIESDIAAARSAEAIAVDKREGLSAQLAVVIEYAGRIAVNAHAAANSAYRTQTSCQHIMAAASRHTLGVISNARRIVGADDEIASANATTALATQSRECDETALASATIDMQVARSNRDVAQRVLAEQSRRIAQTTDKCVKMDGMIEVFNREVAESERLISMCELQETELRADFLDIDAECKRSRDECADIELLIHQHSAKVTAIIASDRTIAGSGQTHTTVIFGDAASRRTQYANGTIPFPHESSSQLKLPHHQAIPPPPHQRPVDNVANTGPRDQAMISHAATRVSGLALRAETASSTNRSDRSRTYNMYAGSDNDDIDIV